MSVKPRVPEDRELLGDTGGVAVGDGFPIEPPVAAGDEGVAHPLGLGPALGDEHVLADRDADRSAAVAGARLPVDPDVPGGGLGGEVGVAVPAVAEPGGPVDRLRHPTADPPFRPLRRQRGDPGPVDGEQVAVHRLAPQQGLDDEDALLEPGGPLAQIGSHGPELAAAAAEAGLDDERAGRHGGQRPDLLGHQHRMPQGDEKQAADRAVRPFGQEATEHRHVLHIPGRTGGVVVAEGQACRGRPARRPAPG